ncbi:hypothetical protein F2Q70_00022876 [Brassica cretica]|uniref:Uncharacterized protein n=1 Tax=Brassica cretica TaxID=69181 RepID=A0A8S9GY81_BRACR|nr:hypothetical protein F2Q70_00022876 [Brassica cretica]
MPPRRPLELREIALQLARSLRRFSFQPLRENPLLDIFFIVRILCFNNKSVNLFLPKSEGFDLSDHLLPYKSGSGLLLEKMGTCQVSPPCKTIKLSGHGRRE